MLRISSKQGVAWLLLSALALLLAPSLAAASRQLKASDEYYQANVETDLPFGVDRFDRWGFQQTIGSYAQVDASLIVIVNVYAIPSGCRCVWYCIFPQQYLATQFVSLVQVNIIVIFQRSSYGVFRDNAAGIRCIRADQHSAPRSHFSGEQQQRVDRSPGGHEHGGEQKRGGGDRQGDNNNWKGDSSGTQKRGDSQQGGKQDGKQGGPQQGGGGGDKKGGDTGSQRQGSWGGQQQTQTQPRGQSGNSNTGMGASGGAQPRAQSFQGGGAAASIGGGASRGGSLGGGGGSIGGGGGSIGSGGGSIGGGGGSIGGGGGSRGGGGGGSIGGGGGGGFSGGGGGGIGIGH